VVSRPLVRYQRDTIPVKVHFEMWTPLNGEGGQGPWLPRITASTLFDHISLAHRRFAVEP
jgi:hypothetical protein